MKNRSTIADRMRRVCTVDALAVALAGCASMPAATAPASLAPDANESLAMVVAAKGVQVYECRAAKDAADKYAWTFVAPEAELFDAAGRTIGRHGAGPNWQASDGSKVTGTVKARADAPIAGAIPWLLLRTKDAGPDGTFSKVTSIQRVNTVGGVMPAAGCARDTAGTTARVAYTADYRLFTVR